MNNIWILPTRKNNKGNHFQLFYYLESINLGNGLYALILKLYFSLTSISQNVSRTQLCTEVYGAPCPHLNNSKQIKTMHIKTNFLRKIEGRKEAENCLCLQCTVPGMCT